MRTYVIALAAAAFGLLAQPAFAAENPGAPATHKTMRHKAPVKHTADRARVIDHGPNFIGDLTGNCKIQRDAGACMIDLGYGRCESCNVGGNL